MFREDRERERKRIVSSLMDSIIHEKAAKTCLAGVVEIGGAFETDGEGGRKRAALCLAHLDNNRGDEG